MLFSKIFPVFSLFLLLFSCTTQTNKTNKKPEASVVQVDSISIKEPAIIPTGLSFSSFKYKDENCDIELPEDFNEGWCNSRSVSGLTVSLNDAAIAQKINGLICKQITGKIGNKAAIKRFVLEIKNLMNQDGEVEYMQEEYICSVIDSSNTFLSLGVVSDFYSLGAAHGVQYFQALNFDLKTGAFISLSDLFENGSRNGLKALAKRKFIAQNGNEGWWFTTGEQAFELAEVFSITNKGITFHYQPYEIGPYVAGAPEIVLSTTDIAKLLKDNPYLKP